MDQFLQQIIQLIAGGQNSGIGKPPPPGYLPPPVSGGEEPSREQTIANLEMHRPGTNQITPMMQYGVPKPSSQDEIEQLLALAQGTSPTRGMPGPAGAPPPPAPDPAAQGADMLAELEAMMGQSSPGTPRMPPPPMSPQGLGSQGGGAGGAPQGVPLPAQGRPGQERFNGIMNALTEEMAGSGWGAGELQSEGGGGVEGDIVAVNGKKPSGYKPPPTKGGEEPYGYNEGDGEEADADINGAMGNNVNETDTDETTLEVPESDVATPEEIVNIDSEETPGMEEEIYTVKKGDSLWKIAEKFYGSGEQYQQIAALNEIDDPNMIQPGMTIVIPKAPKPRQRPTRAAA